MDDGRARRAPSRGRCYRRAADEGNRTGRSGGKAWRAAPVSGRARRSPRISAGRPGALEPARARRV